LRIEALNTEDIDKRSQQSTADSWQAKER